MTALATVMMLLSNFVPTVLFSFPTFAGIVIYILSFVSGSGYAWISYTAVSLLSFFICGSKAVSLCFILFLGYYPLLKKQIEKLRIKIFAYIIKLLIFNAATGCIYCILLFVFSSPVFSKWTNESWMILPLIMALNIIFLIYDLCLSLFFKKYKEKIYNLVIKLLRRF